MLLLNRKMGRLTDLCLCAIFIGGTVLFAQFYTAEAFVDVFTECETPNHEPGFCMEIKQCPVLLNQLQNKDAWAFLRASICSSSRENPTNPKLCCGTYGNFKTIETKEENSILPKSCGRQKSLPSRRIYGGREAFLKEYPWMAILIHKNVHGHTILGCAGFLIHTQYVVTAAHCTHPDVTKLRGNIVRILLGEHNFETTTDCSSNESLCTNKNVQTHKIASVTTHPGYDPADMNHYDDIAIIKLEENARLTEYVQPICLSEPGSQIPTSYSVSGWGKTQTAKYSKVKMHVEIPAFDKVNCMEQFSKAKITLRDTQICAGGEEMADTCTGDSGGPLMMVTKDKTWFASGIVSFGIGCGMRGWPGVYTNISMYLSWITDQMA